MDFQLPLGPDETVPLRITERQRKLILDHLPIPKALEAKLRFGVHEDNLVVFELTLDELDDLAARVAAVAEQYGDRKRGRELGALYDRICQVLDSYAPMVSDEEDVVFPEESEEPSLQHFLPPEVLKKLDALMEQGKIRNQEQFEKAVRELLKEHDAKPLPELHGLSVNQVVAMVNGHWMDPNAPLSLNLEVPLSELEGATLLQNARVFLQAVDDAGAVKATAGGNLNRKFVLAMLDAMQWPPGYVEEMKRVCKKFDEYDVEMLSRIRWLLEKARVIRKYKGHFRIVRKRKALMKDDRAGLLMASLFHIHFREMNLACLDHFPELPELEEGVAYTLAMLDRFAEEWMPFDELALDLFFPNVLRLLESLPDTYFDPLLWCAQSRIIRPLTAFGLLECRYSDEEKRAFRDLEAVRKTPLFNRFLRFNLE